MNTDGLISIATIIGGLVAFGALLGAARITRVHAGWLLASASLVLMNDALLTNLYGWMPNLISQGSWNWQGKTLALFATLALAALPGLGWRRCGLTVRQAVEGFRWPLLVCALYLAFFVCLALVFPNESVSVETLVFQMTLPGLEEEIFYRGLLLFGLMKAFPSTRPALGVDWSLGAAASCILFGLAHAYSFSDGAFNFDIMTMALTTVPSVLVVWLVLKTRSVVGPVLLHNFGNAIFLLL